MPANFPSTPTIGDTYNVGLYQYTWNGSAWILLPQRINERVNLLEIGSGSAVIDLSKGLYHKVTPTSKGSATSVSFTNIPSGSCKWTVEFLHDNNGFNITNGLFLSTGAPVSVSPIADVKFSNDGNFFYVLETTAVTQYQITTPWIRLDIYKNAGSISISGQDASPSGIAFKPDGTKMYMLGGTNDRVYQYTLATPWNIASATYDSVTFSVATQDTAPNAIAFKPDGTKMYMLGFNNRTVYQYTLATPWNIATATYDSVSFSVYTQDTSPRDVSFDDTGTKMYVVGTSTTQRILQYTLSTPWVVNSAAYNHATSARSSTIKASFHPKGKILFASTSTGFGIAAYPLFSTSITWPANVIWETTPPSSLSFQNLVVDFYTRDGGTTIYGSTTFNKNNNFN